MLIYYPITNILLCVSVCVCMCVVCNARSMCVKVQGIVVCIGISVCHMKHINSDNCTLLYWYIYRNVIFVLRKMVHLREQTVVVSINALFISHNYIYYIYIQAGPMLCVHCTSQRHRLATTLPWNRSQCQRYLRIDFLKQCAYVKCVCTCGMYLEISAGILQA